jgi:transcriptional regulator with XRE-family HTH domain
MTEFDEHAGMGLRNIRQAAGISQRELDAKIGLSRKIIERIEAGTRAMRFEEAVIFAQALGVDVWDLITEQDLERGPIEEQLADATERLAEARRQAVDAEQQITYQQLVIKNCEQRLAAIKRRANGSRKGRTS